MIIARKVIGQIGRAGLKVVNIRGLRKSPRQTGGAAPSFAEGWTL